MRLLTPFTNGEWSDLATSNEEDGGINHEDALKSSLADFMRSKNLIILTGLGTSLCIKNDEDEKLAPSMWDLWVAIKEEVTEEVLEEVCTTVRHRKKKDRKTGETNFVPDIELLLSKCLISQQFRPLVKVRDFINQAEGVIFNLCNFLEGDTSLDMHEAFLRRIGRRQPRNPRTKLFTTNYDLAFETAASRISFVVVDGFSHTLPQEFDSSYFAYDFVRREDDGTVPNFIPNVFHLHKLHGSINWQQEGDQIIKQATPDDPVLIYPRHSKFELSYESPFLDQISRFQSALRQTETSLLVIGFGFNDKHLTQPILSAIRGNVGLRTLVVSPALEDSGCEAVEFMESLIVAGDSRIGLLASTFEEFVPLLPDLVSESEEEMHRRRLRGEV